MSKLKRLVRWFILVERDGCNDYRSVYLFGARVEYTLWDVWYKP